MIRLRADRPAAGEGGGSGRGRARAGKGGGGNSAGGDARRHEGGAHPVHGVDINPLVNEVFEGGEVALPRRLEQCHLGHCLRR